MTCACTVGFSASPLKIQVKSRVGSDHFASVPLLLSRLLRRLHIILSRLASRRNGERGRDGLRPLSEPSLIAISDGARREDARFSQTASKLPVLSLILGVGRSVGRSKLREEGASHFVH